MYRERNIEKAGDNEMLEFLKKSFKLYAAHNAYGRTLYTFELTPEDELYMKLHDKLPLTKKFNQDVLQRRPGDCIDA